LKRSPSPFLSRRFSVKVYSESWLIFKNSRVDPRYIVILRRILREIEEESRRVGIILRRRLCVVSADRRKHRRHFRSIRSVLAQGKLRVTRNDDPSSFELEPVKLRDARIEFALSQGRYRVTRACSGFCARIEPY